MQWHIPGYKNYCSILSISNTCIRFQFFDIAAQENITDKNLAQDLLSNVTVYFPWMDLLPLKKDTNWWELRGSIIKQNCYARFGNTYTKIEMTQRRLAWHLHKDDTPKQDHHVEFPDYNILPRHP